MTRKEAAELVVEGVALQVQAVVAEGLRAFTEAEIDKPLTLDELLAAYDRLRRAGRGTVSMDLRTALASGSKNCG